jgi:four helix bundle protein
MNPDELEGRARAFGLRVLPLVDSLPRTLAGRAIGGQLIRSAMSVGANYRAARRARSRREFIAKIAIVCEEADETEYWIGMIEDARLLPAARLQPLRDESRELMQIFAATRRSLRRRQIAKSPDRQIAK